MKSAQAFQALAFASALIGAAVSAPAPAIAAEATPELRADRRPTVSIRFRDLSTVDGPVIRLGDIARVMAGEDKVVAKLETLEVAKAAAFGLTRVIDTDLLFIRHLQPLIDRGGPLGGYNIDAERKSIKVTTRAGTLPAGALTKAVDAYLAGQPRRAGETWKWEVVRAPEEIKVPATPYTLDISFSGARRKGKVVLDLAIRSEDRTLRTLPVAVNLRVEETVLVAKRAIVRDEPLTAANVALELRETTLMNDLAMANPDRLFGRLAKAGIQPGRVITPRLVALPPAVRRGQEAKMVFRNGDVNITAGVVCRQDGVPGQIITAKNLATQRLMRVRVTENGLLEPVPGG